MEVFVCLHCYVHTNIACRPEKMQLIYSVDISWVHHNMARSCLDCHQDNENIYIYIFMEYITDPKSKHCVTSNQSVYLGNGSNQFIVDVMEKSRRWIYNVLINGVCWMATVNVSKPVQLCPYSGITNNYHKYRLIWVYWSILLRCF